MQDLLYLDTARLGLMSPEASRAAADFARFASEYGASLYCTDFLKAGSAELPTAFATRFPGLSSWTGVTGMQTRLKAVAGAANESQLIVASRSLAIMQFAARLMFGPCRNVLITDLTWPSYEQTLQEHPRPDACSISKLKIRNRILEGQICEHDLVEEVTQYFAEHKCDGLFLPAVDNLGIRFPVQKVVDRITQESELRFVALDGAQALGHTGLSLSRDYCDFVVAGSHKWLRASTPMGVGFFGHPRSKDYIQTCLEESLSHGRIRDPLLSFSSELDGGILGSVNETVAVAPLITANAAANAFTEADQETIETNRNTIADVAVDCRWEVVPTGREFSSRILLVRRRDLNTTHNDANEIRRHFHRFGISVSAYRSGLVRISLPDDHISAGEVDRLKAAMSSELLSGRVVRPCGTHSSRLTIPNG